MKKIKFHVEKEEMLTNNWKWGKGSLKRMDGIHPILIEFANRVLSRSKFDLTIPWLGGKRTAEQQAEIYSRGASTLDGVTKKSRHQRGLAVDIVISGKTIGAMYDVEKLEYLNVVAKQVWSEMVNEELHLFGEVKYKMVFGGDWVSFKDLPHYQINRVK